MKQSETNTRLKYALILSGISILLILTDVLIAVNGWHYGLIYYTALWLIPALAVPAIGLWLAVLFCVFTPKSRAAVLMPAVTVLFIILCLLLLLVFFFSDSPWAGMSEWVLLFFGILPLSVSLAVQIICIRMFKKRGIRV